MLYLIDPCSGIPLSRVVPEGTTNVVTESIFTFFPVNGVIVKSFTRVLMSEPRIRISSEIVRGTSPFGPILTLLTPSKFRLSTARLCQVKSAVPFAWVPLVCVGGFRRLSVVPPLAT